MKGLQLVCLFILQSSIFAIDMPLSQVLLESGGEWELVCDGYKATDAACVDEQGNFYFSDVLDGDEIYKVDVQGAVKVYVKGFERISGMQFGPAGALYACQGGQYKRILKIASDGNFEIIAKNVTPNDLVVTHSGFVYVTETRTRKIVMIAPDGVVKRFSCSAVRPNGISLSTDQGTLSVSDHGGDKVYAYRIEADGSLSFEHAYMQLRTRSLMTVSKGDGMASDAYGRWYVTSDLGIQMFDDTGRMGGVILNPQGKAVNSVEFAGSDQKFMYICARESIYRRKTKTKGLFSFHKPFKKQRTPK